MEQEIEKKDLEINQLKKELKRYLELQEQQRPYDINIDERKNSTEIGTHESSIPGNYADKKFMASVGK